MTRRPLPVFAAAMTAGILIIYMMSDAILQISGGSSFAAAFLSLAASFPVSGKAAGALLIALALADYLSGRKRLLSGKGSRGEKSIAGRGGIKRASALFLAAGMVMMTSSVLAPLPPDMENARVTGTVIDVKAAAGKTSIVLDTGKRGRVLVTKYDGLQSGDAPQGRHSRSADLCGRKVTVTGDIGPAADASNLGCFDYRLYLRGKKILAVMRAERIDEGEVRRPVIRRLALFRGLVRDLTENVMSEDGAALLSAMLFGDKSELDDDVYESFRKNGTAHILAVSGLHVGMIYALITALFGGKRRFGRSAAALSVLGCYAVMAGCAPSVVRAVIMIALHILAGILHRRYDMLSAAAAAVTVMLVYEPYALFSSGLQMSFIAVCSIAFLFPMAESGKPRGPVMKAILPPLLIQAGTAPYTAYVFNCFSAGAFLANIPVVFIAGIIVPAGAGVMALTPFSEDLAAVLLRFIDALCAAMQDVNELFYHEGVTSFDVESPPLFLVLLWYALLFGAASETMRISFLRREKGKITKSSLAITLCILCVSYAHGNVFRDDECVFVDVGQGACVHFRTPSGRNILADGGGRPSFGVDEGFDVGKKILMPYLLKNGAGKIDIAFVTHLDADHYKGIVTIAGAGMVKKIAVHECLSDERERIASDTGMDIRDVVTVKTGQTITDGDMRMTVIGPVARGASENSNSLILKYESGGASVLITGDADEEEEGSLVSAYSNNGALRCDVMQVPHHGSGYSSTGAFLGEADPKAAVIQVGKNNYGHPSPETVSRLEERGIRVLRNDTDGAVGLDIGGGKIKRIDRMRRLPRAKQNAAAAQKRIAERAGIGYH